MISNNIMTLKDLRKTLPFPGIEEVLEKNYDNGIRQYIVTNKRAIPSQLIIDLFGWNSYFIGLFSIDSFVPSGMNKLEVIKQVIKKYSIPINQAIYVGDLLEDEEVAINSGLTFAAVSWGYGNWNQIPKNYLKNVSDLLYIQNY